MKQTCEFYDRFADCKWSSVTFSLTLFTHEGNDILQHK